MKQKKHLLMAGGGHGRVVLDTLLAQGLDVFGILDPGLTLDQTIFNVPVLGPDAWLEAHNPGSFLLANGVGATADCIRRRRLYEKWTTRGLGFVSVCHPSATIGRDVILQNGSQIMAGVVIQTRSQIGINAVINTRASIDHDCEIGAHAFIAPGATLCGGVTIGAGAFVGAGAVLIPGVHVGDDAVVGAGATVIRDVPPRQKVIGIPAKPA